MYTEHSCFDGRAVLDAGRGLSGYERFAVQVGEICSTDLALSVNFSLPALEIDLQALLWQLVESCQPCPR